MDTFIDIDLCKLFFASMTLSTVVLGALVNFSESQVPVIISEALRYGKFAAKKRSLLTRLQEVPKSYFRHFYLTAAFIYYPFGIYQVMNVYFFNSEVNGAFRNLLNVVCGYNRVATVSATHVSIAMVLMGLQVYRRFYDTHFVSVFSKNATINLSHYLIGMAYYPAVALVILSEAPAFASAYKVQGFKMRDITLKDLFAILLFLWAWYHQHVTTVILANLRKNSKGEVVSQDYRIPQGDWFNYLSSPHSTAEIVMYTALTILLYNSTGWWYVYTWVVCNQVETILLSHWWYCSNFKDFPAHVKALVPFVY